MLDILMVAHEANYKRMAHRALPSSTRKDETEIRGSLPSAVDSVPVAGKVILSLEGGRHQDFEAAEAYLDSQVLPWQVVHSDEISDYHQAMVRGLAQCTSPVVAIIPAWCEVLDQMWVQRMTWPLSHDQGALLCTTGREQGPAKDLAPFPCKPRIWPEGEIIVGRRTELAGFLALSDPGDFYNDLARAVARNSWRIWAHPGIRFERHPHEDHRAARPANR